MGKIRRYWGREIAENLYLGFGCWGKGILQRSLQVLFREILDRTDTGLELGKIVKEILPLPLLGQYRIGSIWINGKFVEEVHYPVVEFKVSFTEGYWRYKTFNLQRTRPGQSNALFDTTG